MGSTWKTLKDLTFKPKSSQNGRFLEETGGPELPSKNGSLPFITGELEHLIQPFWLGGLSMKSRTSLDFNGLSSIVKSSRSQMFYKIGVVKSFAKFTEKNTRWSFFFNKVAGLTLVTLIKKTPIQVFSCEFCEIFKNTFFLRISLVFCSVC